MKENQMTKRITYLLISGLITLTLLAAVALAEGEAAPEKKEEVTHDFVGAKKCKICHKEEFASWEQTSHAKAWTVLKPEEQKNEECIGCHSTGTTAKDVFLEGVQCEACHGAGADYKKKKIMKDTEKAMAAGLVIPDSTLCLTCHNDKSPNFEGFDFKKYMANPKGMHVIPTAEEAKPEAATEKKES